MSRSYRRPYYTDQQQSRKKGTRTSASVNAKRTANQAVRRMNKAVCQGDESQKIADGKQYRKASCTWDIRDWSSRAPNDPKARRK